MRRSRRLALAAVAATAACAIVSGGGGSKAGLESTGSRAAGGPPGRSSIVLPVIWTHDTTWPRRLHASVRGGSLRWSDLRGSPVVLNFFASWCEPCGREAVLLRRAAQRHRGRVVFLAAAVHDYTPSARRFLRSHRLPFAAVVATGPLVHSFRLIGLPATFYLDARGRVRASTLGELTASALTHGLHRLGGR